MLSNSPKTLSAHWLYPLLALLLASAAIECWGLDRRLADYFYHLQGNTWAWKNAWLAERVFHQGGRALSLSVAVAALIALLVAYTRERFSSHRKPLLYVFCAATGASLLVSLLKAVLAVSCPWEFTRYGAHFVSYDLWTLAVCWFYCLALYLWMFHKAPVRTKNEGLLCQ